MKQKFDVQGMTCAACSAHVEKAVCKVAGVDGVNVNLLGNSMVVDYDEGATDAGQIIHAVEEAGYGASLPDTRKQAAKPRQVNGMEEEAAGMKRRFLTSLIFLVPLFYIAMGHMMGWPLPAFFHGGGHFRLCPPPKNLLPQRHKGGRMPPFGYPRSIVRHCG